MAGWTLEGWDAGTLEGWDAGRIERKECIGMAYCRYFPELTLEQINAIITALHVRMEEKKELYYKCKELGQNESATRLYNEYISP